MGETSAIQWTEEECRKFFFGTEEKPSVVEKCYEVTGAYEKHEVEE